MNETGGLSQGGSRFRRTCLRCVVASLGILLCALAIILIVEWPFTKARTIAALEHFSGSEVRAGDFDLVYIPHPGYIARHVTFSRRSGAGSTQLALMDRLECKGSWLAVISLTHHIAELDIRGLRVFIPAKVPPAMKLHPELKQETSVSHLYANGSVLEIAPRRRNGLGLRFSFARLAIEDIEKQKPLTVQTVLRNPEPAGDLTVNASVGPFVPSKIAEMPLSGSFGFEHADLGQFKSIKGMLSSQGRFSGTLARCRVTGKAHIPDFEVNSSGHAIDVVGEFSTVVDGVKGNLAVGPAEVHFLNTSVRVSGDVAENAENAGKVTNLNLTSKKACMEDLLRIFVKSDPPPVKGKIDFTAKVQLPQRPGEFLRRVSLDSNFDLTGAEFTKQQSQEKVDELSARALGRKHRHDNNPPFVFSELKGHVLLKNAVAKFANVYFTAPGATAQMRGNYNLLPETIDMGGKLAIQASLSKAAGGIKSVLLLPLDPFFIKGNAGAVLPFRITGSYSHPVFKVSLRKRNPT